LEWVVQLPGAGDVDAAARSLGEAGSSVRREGHEAIAADPWGTNLRLTTV
jgi:hypothetical protein